MHRGNHVEDLDHLWFSVKLGTPVRAPADGFVKEIRQLEPGDFVPVIRHNTTLESSFYYLRIVTVKVDDVVKRGQILGYPRERGRKARQLWELRLSSLR